MTAHFTIGSIGRRCGAAVVAHTRVEPAQLEDEEVDDTSSETEADTSPEIKPDDNQAQQLDDDSPDIDEPDSDSEINQN